MAPAACPVMATGGEPEMLGKIRYAALLGLFALILATTVLVVYQRQETLRFIEEGKAHNVAVAQVFAHAVWRRYAPYLVSVATADGAAVKRGPETADMANWIRSIRRGTPILGVNIHNLNGITVFSTNAALIGKGTVHPGNFKAARTGHVITRLNLRDGHAVPSVDGVTYNVLETFVPVRTGDRRVAAVFEMHLDATQLFEQANRDSRCIACGVYLSACRSLQNLMPSYDICGTL